jgi:hypothetical protein
VRSSALGTIERSSLRGVIEHMPRQPVKLALPSAIANLLAPWELWSSYMQSSACRPAVEHTACDRAHSCDRQHINFVL